MLHALSISALQKGSPLDSLETRVLLMHGLGLSRMQLITEADRLLTAEEVAHVTRLFERRKTGEPIAYIVGMREFYGLPLRVSPDVLIPRPETELLVDLALSKLPPGGRVLDMGTGSGAIAIAIAKERPDATVMALDFSAAALAVAGTNAAQLGTKIEFVLSNWFAALGDRQFDLIVSNPPYIERDDPHLVQGDLRFEPKDALTDHADGMAALRFIVGGAKSHLVDGGRLLVEHGYDQATSVRNLFAKCAFSDVRSWADLAGIERVTGGVV